MSLTYISTDNIIENTNENDKKSGVFIHERKNKKKNSRYFFEALKEKE